jgi:hypothetical protein
MIWSQKRINALIMVAADLVFSLVEILLPLASKKIYSLWQVPRKIYCLLKAGS